MFYIEMLMLNYYRSEVFRKMFYGSGGMKEQQDKEWKIEDIKPEDFQPFLNFLYSGKIIITHKVKLYIFQYIICYFITI